MLPDISRRKPDFFDEFQRSMNRMTKEFFGAQAEAPFVPRLDVDETKERLTVTAELPGILEKDVEIEVDRGVLTIRGEKKSEFERKNGDKYYCERTFGSFERSVAVPDSIDLAKIEAKFDKGVLRVDLPKRIVSQDEPKKIPIKH